MEGETVNKIFEFVRDGEDLYLRCAKTKTYVRYAPEEKVVKVKCDRGKRW